MICLPREQDRVAVDGRIPVVPGLSMPFYPARPSPGYALSNPAQAVQQLKMDVDAGHLCQPKWNGDRACLGVVLYQEAVRVMIQNRMGGWTTQAVHNAQDFAHLGPGSCLDGEVLGGIFYPFECLALEGHSFLQWPAQQRAALAKTVCAELDLEWKFEPITPVVVRRLRKNLPTVEGYVCKFNSPYPIGRSLADETRSWRKMKW